MIGEYKLKEDKRFRVGVTSFGMCKNSKAVVTQIDKDNHKVLMDFGSGLIDWMPESILGCFHSVK